MPLLAPRLGRRVSVRRKNVLVAPRSRACRICKELVPALIADVNAAIWPEPGVAVRARDYRIAAARVCRAHGLEVEEKSVTRHAKHIEASWHRVTTERPAGSSEIAVFPTDYQSVAQHAAQLGMQAMGVLSKRVAQGTMEDRELVATAKLGVGAVQQREALRIRQQEADTAQGFMAAVFGLAAGHVGEDDVPEVEVIDVTPVEVLHVQVQEERAALRRLQAGEADRAR